MPVKSLCMVAGAAVGLLWWAGIAAAQESQDVERAYMAELMADSAARTSELGQRDANFTADVHGYFQFRYNWNWRDRAEPRDNSDHTIGFQAARTRLNVGGNAINRDFSYFLQFGANPEGEFLLDDVYGAFRFENGWQVQFGQFRLPYSREYLVIEPYQLAAERSVAGTSFLVGRSHGIMIGFTGERTRFSVSVNDGIRGTADFFNTVADVALTARVEAKWAGEWHQARDFTSFPESPYFGMFGLAAHWQDGGGTFGTTDHDMIAVTADVSMEGNGWNFFAAGHYDSSQISPHPNLTDWAIVVQGGMFVAPRLEFFGRWDAVFPDSDWPADSDFHTITVGLNHYFIPGSHAAKFTLDFQWFLDSPQDTGPVFTDSLLGLLDDSGDNQWNLRAQVLLMF